MGKGKIVVMNTQLEQLLSEIQPSDRESMRQAADRWKTVGKPLYSLGKLEEAVIKMAGIKGTPDYELKKKGLIILCADNGVVAEGVTQTGQEVTAIVAENFTRNATSVCMMSKVAGVDVFPYDVGMATFVPSVTKEEYKTACGTQNIVRGPAMSREEAIQTILTGVRIVQHLSEEGYDLLATGEMGIGNTTTSSAVFSVLSEMEPAEVTGRGAGLSSEGLNRKIDAICKAIRVNCPDRSDPIDVLAKVGGFDLAGLVGVFIGGAVYHVPVIIDGFISSVAALCAVKLNPSCIDYMMPSHCSGEPAGRLVMENLGLSPLIQCNMSLGEGSGAVAVVPLLEMGLSVYRNMGTFEEIHVEQYEDLNEK